MGADKLQQYSVTGGLSEKGIRVENTHHSLKGTKSGNSCSALSMTMESKFSSAEGKKPRGSTTSKQRYLPVFRAKD